MQIELMHIEWLDTLSGSLVHFVIYIDSNESLQGAGYGGYGCYNNAK